MGLFGLLTLPLLGPPRLVYGLASAILGEMRRESLDEGRVRSELLELQQRYELGEVEEEDYERQERALLERMAGIRELKASEAIAMDKDRKSIGATRGLGDSSERY